MFAVKDAGAGLRNKEANVDSP